MSHKNLLSLLDCGSGVGRGIGGIRDGMRGGSINARIWEGLDLALHRRRLDTLLLDRSEAVIASRSPRWGR